MQSNSVEITSIYKVTLLKLLNNFIAEYDLDALTSMLNEGEEEDGVPDCGDVHPHAKGSNGGKHSFPLILAKVVSIWWILKAVFHWGSILATCSMLHWWTGLVRFHWFDRRQHVACDFVAFDRWQHVACCMLQVSAYCLVLNAFPPVTGNLWSWKQQNELEPKKIADYIES